MNKKDLQKPNMFLFVCGIMIATMVMIAIFCDATFAWFSYRADYYGGTISFSDSEPSNNAEGLMQNRNDNVLQFVKGLNNLFNLRRNQEPQPTQDSDNAYSSEPVEDSENQEGSELETDSDSEESEPSANTLSDTAEEKAVNKTTLRDFLDKQNNLRSLRSSN